MIKTEKEVSKDNQFASKDQIEKKCPDCGKEERLSLEKDFSLYKQVCEKLDNILVLYDELDFYQNSLIKELEELESLDLTRLNLNSDLEASFCSMASNRKAGLETVSNLESSFSRLNTSNSTLKENLSEFNNNKKLRKTNTSKIGLSLKNNNKKRKLRGIRDNNTNSNNNTNTKKSRLSPQLLFFFILIISLFVTSVFGKEPENPCNINLHGKIYCKDSCQKVNGECLTFFEDDCVNCLVSDELCSDNCFDYYWMFFIDLIFDSYTNELSDNFGNCDCLGTVKGLLPQPNFETSTFAGSSIGGNLTSTTKVDLPTQVNKGNLMNQITPTKSLTVTELPSPETTLSKQSTVKEYSVDSRVLSSTEAFKKNTLNSKATVITATTKKTTTPKGNPLSAIESIIGAAVPSLLKLGKRSTLESQQFTGYYKDEDFPKDAEGKVIRAALKDPSNLKVVDVCMCPQTKRVKRGIKPISTIKVPVRHLKSKLHSKKRFHNLKHLAFKKPLTIYSSNHRRSLNTPELSVNEGNGTNNNMPKEGSQTNICKGDILQTATTINMVLIYDKNHLKVFLVEKYNCLLYNDICDTTKQSHIIKLSNPETYVEPDDEACVKLISASKLQDIENFNEIEKYCLYSSSNSESLKVDYSDLTVLLQKNCKYLKYTGSGCRTIVSLSPGIVELNVEVDDPMLPSSLRASYEGIPVIKSFKGNTKVQFNKVSMGKSRVTGWCNGKSFYESLQLELNDYCDAVSPGWIGKPGRFWCKYHISTKFTLFLISIALTVKIIGSFLSATFFVAAIILRKLNKIKVEDRRGLCPVCNEKLENGYKKETGEDSGQHLCTLQCFKCKTIFNKFKDAVIHSRKCKKLDTILPGFLVIHDTIIKAIFYIIVLVCGVSILNTMVKLTYAQQANDNLIGVNGVTLSGVFRNFEGKDNKGILEITGSIELQENSMGKWNVEIGDDFKNSEVSFLIQNISDLCFFQNEYEVCGYDEQQLTGKECEEDYTSWCRTNTWADLIPELELIKVDKCGGKYLLPANVDPIVLHYERNTNSWSCNGACILATGGILCGGCRLNWDKQPCYQVISLHNCETKFDFVANIDGEEIRGSNMAPIDNDGVSFRTLDKLSTWENEMGVIKGEEILTGLINRRGEYDEKFGKIQWFDKEEIFSDKELEISCETQGKVTMKMKAQEASKTWSCKPNTKPKILCNFGTDKRFEYSECCETGPTESVLLSSGELQTPELASMAVKRNMGQVDVRMIVHDFKAVSLKTDVECELEETTCRCEGTFNDILEAKCIVQYVVKKDCACLISSQSLGIWSQFVVLKQTGNEILLKYNTIPNSNETSLEICQTSVTCDLKKVFFNSASTNFGLNNQVNYKSYTDGNSSIWNKFLYYLAWPFKTLWSKLGSIGGSLFFIFLIFTFGTLIILIIKCFKSKELGPHRFLAIAKESYQDYRTRNYLTPDKVKQR